MIKSGSYAMVYVKTTRTMERSSVPVILLKVSDETVVF